MGRVPSRLHHRVHVPAFGPPFPQGYLAEIDERVKVVSADDEAAKQYIPDVAVARSPRGEEVLPKWDQAGATALAVAPVTIPSVDAIEVSEASIEIVRLPDHDLVTSVELLSPWNKFGEG